LTSPRLRPINKRVSAIRHLRTAYQNWFSVLWRGALNRSTTAVSRRDRLKLEGFGSFDLVRLAKLLSNDWKVQEITQSHITLDSPTGLTIKCRRKSADIGTLSEIFIDQPYPSDVLGKIVLDIGMSSGDSAIFFAANGAKKVIGLEPHEESFALAVENITSNGLGHVIFPIKCALFSSSREAELRVSTNDPTENSLKYSDYEGEPIHDAFSKVRTITLAEVTSTFALERIDFLKMDCEGCEYEVLNSLTLDVSSKLGEVVLEFHSGPQNLPILFSNIGFEVKYDRTKRGFLYATHPA
jgi:FkbM family methyltransferase